jgi:hypothetical protein
VKDRGAWQGEQQHGRYTRLIEVNLVDDPRLIMAA